MGDMNFIIRADGSPEKGLGLVTRSITLANILKNYGSVVFLVREGNLVRDFVKSKGYEAMLVEGDEEQEYGMVKRQLKQNTKNVFITSLKNVPSYLREINAFTVFLHPFPASEPVKADLNIYPFPTKIAGYPSGFPYLIINGAFMQKQKTFLDIKKIFIAQGGSDPYNLTCKIIEALDKVKGDFEITAVLGLLYPYDEELGLLITKTGKKVNVLKNISAEEMAREIADADIAVSSASETIAEICYVGTPVIAVNHHERQNNLGQLYHERGAIINLGVGAEIANEKITQEIQNLISDKEKRERLAKTAQSLIDGKGASRIAALILEKIK